MTNSVFDIFRIDRLGKGIFSKLIFTFGLLVGISVYFCPLGDTDFSAFIAWFENTMSSYDAMMNASYADLSMLTPGNYIFLGHVMASNFLIIFCSFVYTAVYIRQYRKEHGLMDPGDSGYLIPPRFLKPLTVGRLVLRMIIFFCFSLIIFIPATIGVLYLFLIFIIILPYMSMYPACYLSGDSGLISSFSEMIKVVKGYYLVNSRNILLILSILVVGNWISSALMSFVPSIAYVLRPLIQVFISLSYGRYIGKVYCRMREVPGGLIRVTELP